MAVHLSVRSHFSLLNGTMSVEDVVLTAKNRGYTSVALTEHHVLFSALDFYNAALKHGIKPIIGLEINIEDYESLLIARNNKGLKLLYRLSYKMSQKKPIEYEDFKDQLEDVFFILYGESGPFDADILQNNWTAIESKLLTIKQACPTFFIGLSHQESRFFKASNQQLRLMASNHDIKCVALPKVYYKDEKDHDIYQALRAIDKGTHLHDSSLSLNPNRWFIPSEKMLELYDTQLVNVTDHIADSCSINLYESKTQLPQFENNHHVSNEVYLSELSKMGLKKRLNNQLSKDYLERLEFELNVITSMRFTDYFLIVYDVIRYAKTNGINVGPGRGSAAGSLVSYSLGITDVDPMKYGLLFERFLNPERITMPDIDIDFPDNRRDEVIAYTKEKYGNSHVAHIITFGTLKAKQSFRDAARVLQISIGKVNQVAKLLENDSLQNTFDKSARLRTVVNGDAQIKAAFELANKLENLPRHVSMHAAGIVLSKGDLIDICPLYQIDEDNQCIQFDMTNIESLGLIKIDYLGIRNLTIIQNVVDEINRTDPSFNLKNIPLDDPQTFKMLQDGDTLGIFQLESDGMKQLLRRMKPMQFTDIVDANALFRPGPMENIPVYIENKANPQKITYIHENLKSITTSTHGVLIYQEQIMEVAKVFAGFSLGKADILRRAMGKKDAGVLESLREDFVNGCLNNGYTQSVAVEIFELIYKFANYGFNKSHSLAYSLISYQMAYLKANYPEIFYTYLLTSSIGSDQKTGQTLDECRRRGLTILPIDINESYDGYTYKQGGIRVPFSVLKGMSQSTAQTIVEEREAYGQFESIFECFARLKEIQLNRKQLESLIDVGAFDSLFDSRSVLRNRLEDLLQYADLVRITDESMRFNFSIVSVPYLAAQKDSSAYRLYGEQSTLGFYLSEHPTTSFKKKHQLPSLVSLKAPMNDIKLVAIVDKVKKHRAKNGKMMAFLSISDDTGTCDAILFPNLYDSVGELVNKGDMVLVQGNMKEQGTIILDKIKIFREPSDLH
ncbi:DNA polymerase III subunit alpha [Erysipelothrix larvae]|uniref:DNA polymerase III subunit alpha n=1 Tax=Erysipelothrix larvae TaxID=1514105 RepID=A0A109UGV0_9FIRM|nr:DNA polymerase III subunit alpha [Erysipelothrix larvae]AMC93302.1 DNA polymerase III subunit alpha [Erysipelothrix larvae]